MSLTASVEKLADAGRRYKEFGDNQDTVDNLATKADEAEAIFKSYQEQVHSPEIKSQSEGKQLVEKDRHLVVIRSVLLFLKSISRLPRLRLSALLRKIWSTRTYMMVFERLLLFKRKLHRSV